MTRISLRTEKIFQEVRKRWILFVLIGLYLLAGLLFSFLIYHEDWDQAATRWSARIYPLPAARVNGEIIWLSSYYRRAEIIDHYAARTDDRSSVPADRGQRNRATLDQLIDLNLIRQQAKKAGITVSQQELNQSYAKFAEETKKNQNLDSSVDAQENFKKVLENFYGITPLQFTQEILTIKLYQDKVRNQFFTQVHVQTIVVRDEKQAQDVLARLKKGENFADLAKNFSIDLSSRDQGGDFGWIQRGQLNNQDLENAVFNLKTGEITEKPIKTDFGYHIMKVVERKDGPISDKSYDQWFKDIHSQARITRYVAQ